MIIDVVTNKPCFDLEEVLILKVATEKKAPQVIFNIRSAVSVKNSITKESCEHN